MELFPQIDERRTINNAKKFLKNTFPQWVLQSGLSTSDIQSPTISDMPSSAPVGNSNERKVLKMIERQDDVKAVLKSINAPSRFERMILREVFLNHMPDWKVANKIGYSIAREQSLKKHALLNFAYAMEAYGFDLIVNEKVED